MYGKYIVMIVTLVASIVLAVPLDENHNVTKPIIDSEKELQLEQTCKKMCEHCGCKGFYCGDECICDCNTDNDDDIKCLATMKQNCMQLKLPFEMLIQGSAGSRFVREVLKDDDQQQCLADKSKRQERSVMSLYKPDNEVVGAAALGGGGGGDSEIVGMAKAKKVMKKAQFRNVAEEEFKKKKISLVKGKMAEEAKKKALILHDDLKKLKPLLKGTDVFKKFGAGEKITIKKISALENKAKKDLLKDAGPNVGAPLDPEVGMAKALIVQPAAKMIKAGALLKGGLLKGAIGKALTFPLPILPVLKPLPKITGKKLLFKKFAVGSPGANEEVGAAKGADEMVASPKES